MIKLNRKNKICKLISLFLSLFLVILIFPIKTVSAAPSFFDLRNINAVTSVKNQGSANTCWAFAAIGAIESSLIINGYADSDINLSEAHLAWFALNSEITDINDLTYGDGCSVSNPYILGGNDLYVTWALARGFGLELEEFVEYDEEYINFTSVREKERYVSEYTVNKINVFSKIETESIKEAIIENGALMASYMDVSENYINSSNGYCFFENEYSSTNHATLIVGWDDNFSKENFGNVKPNSNGAWICRNTRGAFWGDEGYFYMSYETTSLNRIISFEAEPVSKELYQIYQYDGYGYSKALSINDSGYVYISNIYDITEKGELDKIAFYSANKNLNHEISVYSLKKEYNSPMDGELLCSFKKETTHIGYTLCTLPYSANVEQGDTISIVIKIIGEGRVQFYSEGTDNRTSIVGKSFVSSNTQNWLDIAESGFGNLCIKAWVNPVNYTLPNIEEVYELMHVYSKEYYEDGKLFSLLTEANNIIKHGDNERAVLNNYLRLSCLYDKYNTCIIIENEKQFLEWASSVNCGNYCFDKVIKLANDLNFTDLDFISPENFGGVFNGNSHSISGIHLENEFSGVFNTILKNGIIKNLNVVNSTFKANGYSGGICSINNGTILDSNVYAHVYSENACCGLISGLNSGNIVNCTTRIFNDYSNLGSISGNNNYGSISNCLSNDDKFVVSGNNVNNTYTAAIDNDFFLIKGIDIPMDIVAEYLLLYEKKIDSNYQYIFTGFSFDNITTVLLGDVDGDGTLSTSDYLIIKNMFLGNSVFDETDCSAADINGSNEIDATDYILIKSHFLKKINIYGS